jgi:hypothetical protein
MAKPLLLSSIVAFGAFAVVLSARPQQPAAGRFQPQGVKVAIPGTDHCFVYVAFLENGSWYDAASPEDSPVVRSGTVIDTESTRPDVNDVVRWLQHFLEHSPDMRTKAKAACEATGLNFIQIGIVRDDPRAGPGAWYFDRGERWGGTPLVILDFGDIEKLTKHVESTAMGNPDRERSARQRIAAVVPVTLFAHECDHAQRAPYIREQELFFANIRAVRNLTEEEIRSGNEFYRKYRDDLEQKAIDDENAVILDLDEFKHTGYSRTGYTDGKGGIPFKIDGVQVRVNAAKALGSVEHRHGTEHRFADLDSRDQAALERIPLAVNRAEGARRAVFAKMDKTLPSVADPEAFRVPHAFTRFPLTKYKFNPERAKQLLDQAGWTVGGDGIRTKGGKRLWSRRLSAPVDAADANVAKVNSAPVNDRNQNAGASVLQWVDNAPVIVERSRAPHFPWAIGVRSVAQAFRAAVGGQPALKRPWSGISPATAVAQPSAAPPTVKAIFVATGRSSGAAFHMTLAYDGAEPLELVDPGFVLEAVQGATAAQAEREIANLKGRRVTATIDAYCLQMQKPPPAAGMVYRLARNPVQERNPHLAPIMIASKVLQDAQQLHPDTDPAQYFHTIRQWAFWAHEQQWKTEAEFADAFIEHSKKNVATAGRQWTRELEQNVRRRLPNRWRDISEVMKVAGFLSHDGR